ncbi:alpha-ribazole phosphatase [Comamonas faecalis]|uniref:Alpha-ribazole phosphatase n=1 Tax=Comamonas faecalis TaxID=1387849 RepID=A0ABP7RBI5_9BURK
MSQLWLVRHARPLQADGLCYGRLDLAADAQATALAALQLHTALPPDVAALRHSPLLRCAQLAQQLQALRPALALTADPRLAEMDFGSWEGRTWSAIDRQALDAWAADLAGHAPGGGEPLAAMLQRVAAALRQARAQARQAGGADQVWITHAGVARCVDWLLGPHATRTPQAHEWPVQAPVFGGWACIPL